MILIGIAGGAGSGKTTLAKGLKEALLERGKTADFLSLDDFYFDDGINGRYIIGKTNGQRFLDWNHPDSVNQQAAQSAIDASDTDVLMIEGLFPLAIPAIFAKLDVSIYLDTPADIRLGRKMARKFREKQMSPEIVLRNYLETVRERHFKFVEPSKAKAALVLDGTMALADLIENVLIEIGN